MSKFKFYITMNCVSFTVLVLIYTVLCVFGMSSVNEIAILILLLMTTCIAAAIFFADKLPVNSAAVSYTHLGRIARPYAFWIWHARPAYLRRLPCG